MDFSDTKEEAEYRAGIRAWLNENAERKRPGSTFRVKQGADDLVPPAKDWQAKKYDAGYAGITLPEEYGGQGGTPLQQVIYNQEEADFVAPRGVYEIGLGMCIPTMLTYATEEQKIRYAVPALEGKEIWCQLFSEPSAGSDLAGLRTRCVRDGDDWVINGQKIWTSGAHFSDYGVIVVRSDPTAPKHKGLTYFFLDMNSPGIEVRRIKQVSGVSNFNEVFVKQVSPTCGYPIPNGLESVRRLYVGLQSFRSMSRMDASLMKASALRLRFSLSLASRRQRLSQAMVRSTTQRLGWTTKPFTRSDRLTISVSRSGRMPARAR